MKKEMRTFTIYRRADSGGVSGKGRIVDGVIFHNGWVAACWRTDIDGLKHGHTSVSIFSSWESFEYVHINAHPENETIIVYGDDHDLSELLDKELILKGLL